MRYLTFALVALLSASVGSVTSPGQSTPDFSGSWRLDLSRSDAAAQAAPPGLVTVVIKQTDTDVHITTTTSRGTTDTRYPFVAADAPPMAAGPNARWQGDTLVTNALRDVRGQSVTVQQSRRLSADGNEMIVDSVVNVQHGYSATRGQTYGASKDIYVKMPPTK